MTRRILLTATLGLLAALTLGRASATTWYSKATYISVDGQTIRLVARCTKPITSVSYILALPAQSTGSGPANVTFKTNTYLAKGDALVHGKPLTANVATCIIRWIPGQGGPYHDIGSGSGKSGTWIGVRMDN